MERELSTVYFYQKYRLVVYCHAWMKIANCFLVLERALLISLDIIKLSQSNKNIYNDNEYNKLI